MGFRLDQILRDQNLELVQAIQDGPPSRHQETLLWQDRSGPLEILRIKDGLRLRLCADLAVDVIDRRLAVMTTTDVPQITIDHFLADQVLPRVMSHAGDLVLHAGGIHDDAGAILLLGASGSGKSTLVGSFLQTGWSLIGDDALVLSAGDGRVTARAVYPSLRLFADSIEALFSASIQSQAMAHHSTKRRIDVLAWQADAGPAPVKAMFVLKQNGPVNTRRLSVAQACMAVVQNSFALDPTDRDRARDRLEVAACLAAEVPAFSLSYPRDFRRLGEVREALLSAIAADRQSSPGLGGD